MTTTASAKLSSGASSVPMPPEVGLWRVRLRRFSRRPAAVAALLLLVFLHATSLLAAVVSPYPTDQIDLRPQARLSGPSSEHILGTDDIGRDVLSRLLYGSRISLGVGLVAMGLAISLGVILGLTAGWYGGVVDAVIMRVADGMLSIPLFFFVLIATAALGPTLPNLVLIMGLSSWMIVARVVRGEVLQVRSLEYIEAAHALGAQAFRIMLRHVLPQVVPSVIVAATLGVAHAILTESALSFLGLGVQPPDASWGNMLSGAQDVIWNAPLLAVYPGVLILITVLAYSALGDGLRDALDPSTAR